MKFYICVAVIVFGFIMFGFDSKFEKLVTCTAEHTRWVDAEYSAMDVSIDMDGNVTPEVDSWDEKASRVLVAMTVNGELDSSEPVYKNSDSYYTLADYPAINQHLASDGDFDQFVKRDRIVMTAYTENEYFTFTTTYSKCLDKLDRYITVKQWYGITTSTGSF